MKFLQEQYVKSQAQEFKYFAADNDGLNADVVAVLEHYNKSRIRSNT